jgi:hypothetical protein
MNQLEVAYKQGHDSRLSNFTSEKKEFAIQHRKYKKYTNSQENVRLIRKDAKNVEKIPLKRRRDYEQHVNPSQTLYTHSDCISSTLRPSGDEHHLSI